MIVFELGETKDRLRSGRVLGADDRIEQAGFVSPLSYQVPHDSGRKTLTSRLLATLFDDCDETLVWIDEFGIFPNAEDWNLFDRFRLSKGIASPLWETPGHLFTSSESDDLRSLLALVLYFIWGAVVTPKTGEFVVRISHDEFINVYCRDDVSRAEMAGTDALSLMR